MTHANKILGDRLSRAREARGLSQQDLGEMVGMSQQAIAAIESGKVQRPRRLRELARSVGVSEEHLLNEYVPILPETIRALESAVLRAEMDEPSIIPMHEAERNGTSTDAGEDRALGYAPSIAGAIPEIDVEVGTGDGTVGQVLQIATKGGAVSGHMINHEWVIPSRAMDAPVAHVIAMPVVGSSMEPTLRAGDTVFVDLRLTAVKSTEIYVIDEGDGPMAKRVRINRDVDPAVIEISSDNPTVKPFTRPAEFVRVIGRVVGKFSKL